MVFNMLLQQRLHVEPFTALFTLKSIFPSVHKEMILMLSFSFKGSVTKFTNIPYSLVCIHVIFVMAGIDESSFTFVTVVFKLASVHTHVFIEIAWFAEYFITSVT